jgi:hypothetical protein
MQFNVQKVPKPVASRRRLECGLKFGEGGALTRGSGWSTICDRIVLAVHHHRVPGNGKGFARTQVSDLVRGFPETQSSIRKSD